MKLEDLECGDLVIVDRGGLGFDIRNRKGEQVCFINRIGEGMLLEWLLLKSENAPGWVLANVERIKKERGFPDDFHC